MDTINTVIFYILCIICTVSAVFCLFQKNTLNTAISAAVAFFGISGLCFLLSAPHLGVLHFLVMSGATGILMLFSVMILKSDKKNKISGKISLQAIAAPVVGAIFMIILVPFILYEFGGLKNLINHTAQDFATTLYTKNILSAELLGILIFTVTAGFFAVLINRANKIKATRLVKTPENQTVTGKEGV